MSENRKGHGIHSPFVYDLVTRIFVNKSDLSALKVIENIRKRLMRDDSVINVYDLGAGSAGEGVSPKKVSDIARRSSVPQKYGILLSNMAREFGAPMIAEFGTSLGISAMYMAASCPGAVVFTMEGSPSVAAIAFSNFEEAGLRNVRVLTGSFEEKLPEIISRGIKPGLVFIDGNHRKAPLLDYFGKIAEISGSGTVVIIDDINYSLEMNEAWCEIKEHEKVSLTIDIFRMGIIFFRKGINRNNYIIRY